MKSFKKLLLLVLALTFVFNSCTIEKRKYLSGYNIEWKHSKNSTNTIPDIQPVKPLELIQAANIPQPVCNLKIETNPVDESLVASIDKNQIILRKHKRINFAFKEDNSPIEKGLTSTSTKAESNREIKIITENKIETTKVNTKSAWLLYKFFSLFGIGFLLNKLIKAINKNKLGEGPEKKKKHIGIIILIIVLLVLALAFALSAFVV